MANILSSQNLIHLLCRDHETVPPDEQTILVAGRKTKSVTQQPPNTQYFYIGISFDNVRK